MFSYILWVEALLIEGSSFPFFQIACVFKARISPQFNRARKLKGVAGFKKQTELNPYKNRSKKSNLINLQF